MLLKGAKLNEADLSGAKFTGLDLRGVDLMRVKSLSKADFVRADLHKADLTKANLSEADLQKANLSAAKLMGANLREAKLKGANLMKADLTDAKVNKISYSQTYPNKELGSKSSFSNEAHGAADLTGANLTNATLIGVDLSWMDLNNTTLAGSNLTDANLTGTNLTKKDLKRANLCNTDLSYLIMVQTDLSGSTLTGCRVHGTAVCDIRLKGAIQSDYVISRKEDASITVQSLQMAQFIYFLLDRKNFRDFFDTVTSKLVLILGRFIQERKIILDGIANELLKYDLIPIIFDFDRPASRDFTETIKTLAGISLFIIADLTNPKSLPLELQAIIPDYQVPIVSLLQEGEVEFSMFGNLVSKYHWVLKPVIKYSSLENLLRSFKQVIIVPAMHKHHELQRKKAAVVEKKSIEDFLKK
ncbi:hypothetical protein EHM76_05275 [bacterium]|nr:MAG: hypothetical protein EHM76_05275 [bacterium]